MIHGISWDVPSRGHRLDSVDTEISARACSILVLWLGLQTSQESPKYPRIQALLYSQSPSLGASQDGLKYFDVLGKVVAIPLSPDFLVIYALHI